MTFFVSYVLVQQDGWIVSDGRAEIVAPMFTYPFVNSAIDDLEKEAIRKLPVFNVEYPR